MPKTKTYTSKDSTTRDNIPSQKNLGSQSKSDNPYGGAAGNPVVSSRKNGGKK